MRDNVKEFEKILRASIELNQDRGSLYIKREGRILGLLLYLDGGLSGRDFIKGSLILGGSFLIIFFLIKIREFIRSIREQIQIIIYGENTPPYGVNYDKEIYEKYGVFAYVSPANKEATEEILSILPPPMLKSVKIIMQPSVVPKAQEYLDEVKEHKIKVFIKSVEEKIGRTLTESERKKIRENISAEFGIEGLGDWVEKFVIIRDIPKAVVEFESIGKQEITDIRQFKKTLIHEISHLWLTNPLNSEYWRAQEDWLKRFKGHNNRTDFISDYAFNSWIDKEAIEGMRPAGWFEDIVESNMEWVWNSKECIEKGEKGSQVLREKILFIARLHLENSYLRIYDGKNATYKDIKIGISKEELTWDKLKNIEVNFLKHSIIEVGLAEGNQNSDPARSKSGLSLTGEQVAGELTQKQSQIRYITPAEYKNISEAVTTLKQFLKA
ncbi:TPA: hypothetical protein EYP70_04465, partial [Candidatus Bathyarchaeota archaeon]|nr:hypothetical protein [Candidatus Bathyarchaeota archaeon]